MNDELKILIGKVCADWDKYKSQEKQEKDYDGASHTNVRTVFGDVTSWNNPDLIWLLARSYDGGYDGSGLQIGLSRDGGIFWEYQSHCSCDGFGDSSGLHSELHPGADMSKKSYELESLPEDWEDVVKKNLEIILNN